MFTSSARETDMDIDTICGMAKSAELRNALHACRDGHPWNKTAKHPFRNAWFMASQRPSYEISSEALRWLEKQADKRGEPKLQEIFAA
jgi:hypothetical protein